MRSGPVGDPDRLAHRGDKGWGEPREKPDSGKREPLPPRGTIGSNDPEFRSEGGTK
jgi:hypothetical protein